MLSPLACCPEDYVCCMVTEGGEWRLPSPSKRLGSTLQIPLVRTRRARRLSHGGIESCDHSPRMKRIMNLCEQKRTQAPTCFSKENIEYKLIDGLNPDLSHMIHTRASAVDNIHVDTIPLCHFMIVYDTYIMMTVDMQSFMKMKNLSECNLR